MATERSDPDKAEWEEYKSRLLRTAEWARRQAATHRRDAEECRQFAHGLLAEGRNSDVAYRHAAGLEALARTADDIADSFVARAYGRGE